MSLFDKIKEPVFLKQSTAASDLLEQLNQLRAQAAGPLVQELDDEIRRVELGIYGENAVRFELENSHIPMYVLHDLYLEHNGLSAQIDYLLVTRGCVFVLECKNLYGDIEINASGDFIRTVQYARRTKKEGIYSPITQNRRHLELIRAIRSEQQSNVLSRALFEKYFYDCNRAVVVLANSKTVLYDRYAKKEVKAQVIRADGLAEYIRKTNALPQSPAISEKQMQEMAQYFLSLDRPQTVDRLEKYRTALAQQQEGSAPAPAVPVPPQKPAHKKAEPRPEPSPKPTPDPAQSPSSNPAPVQKETAPPTSEIGAAAEPVVLCPKCGAPMVKRVAAKGPNAGKTFYGCSRFPHCRGIVNLKTE